MLETQTSEILEISEVFFKIGNSTYNNTIKQTKIAVIIKL